MSVKRATFKHYRCADCQHAFQKLTWSDSEPAEFAKSLECPECKKTGHVEYQKPEANEINAPAIVGDIRDLHSRTPSDWNDFLKSFKGRHASGQTVRHR